MSILAVGSVAFDSIETPAGKAERVLGGSASHFAVAASNFVPVSVVAIVGEDFSDEHLQTFASKGIDTSGIAKVPGLSFAWGGRYSEDFHDRETLFTHLNVFEHFKPKLSPEQAASSHLFLGNIHPDIQMDVLRQAQSPELVCCDTMNFWITGAKDRLLEVLRLVDILIINDSEALLLSGKSDLDSAASAILRLMDSEHNRFSPTLVIKQAEAGAAIFQGSAFAHTPAFPVANVIDPTGAGDSFAGGFVGFLAETRDYSLENMEKAVSIGCATASFNLENFGLEDLRKASKVRILERAETLRF